MGPGRGDGSSHTGISAQAATDQGLTGANGARPGLREALAACRAGDTLVVTKLDRLARSLRDAKDIIDELTGREVKLSIGGSVHDPTIPPAGSSSTSLPWSPNSKPT
jgi:DNA invertase Pin-like site-specific DNA recombinase